MTTYPDINSAIRGSSGAIKRAAKEVAKHAGREPVEIATPCSYAASNGQMLQCLLGVTPTRILLGVNAMFLMGGVSDADREHPHEVTVVSSSPSRVTMAIHGLGNSPDLIFSASDGAAVHELLTGRALS